MDTRSDAASTFAQQSRLCGLKRQEDNMIAGTLEKSFMAAPDGADEGEVFEIFQQQRKDTSPHHGGNLLAPDHELAVHYAREFYGRRQESLMLWIIPRTAIWEIADMTAPAPCLQALADRQGKANEHLQAVAVFAQMQAGQAFVWSQDIANMSMQAVAQSLWDGNGHDYRGNCVRLWLCSRNSIVELANKDLLQPPLDRSYRRLDGYNIREKLRLARQRMQVQGERSS